MCQISLTDIKYRNGDDASLISQSTRAGRIPLSLTMALATAISVGIFCLASCRCVQTIVAVTNSTATGTGAWLLSDNVGARFYVAIDSGNRSRTACRARLTAAGHREGERHAFLVLSPPVELAELSNSLSNALSQPLSKYEHEEGELWTTQRDFTDRVRDQELGCFDSCLICTIFYHAALPRPQEFTVDSVSPACPRQCESFCS